MRTELGHMWLLAKREYLQRVRSKSFVISTAIIPLFMFAFVVLPSKLITMRMNTTSRILVATDNPQLANEFQRQLERKSKDAASSIQIEVRTVTGDGAAPERQRLETQANQRGLEGVLWLTTEGVNRGQVPFAMRSATDFVLIGSLRSAVVLAAAKYRLARHGVKDENFEEVLKLDLETTSLQPGSAAGGETSFYAAMFLVFVMYMSVLVNGMAVMRSVLEEKNSRVMEVLLATVTPRELMAGKILGVGAVGLTQIAIWALLAVIFSLPGIMATQSSTPQFHLSWTMGLGFVIFYLLGYLLYSAMSASVGAAVGSEEEAQQWQMLVVMPIVAAVALMFLIYRQPNSTLAIVLSMVPFFAPILMYLRTVLQTPAAWQLALCIGLLIATIYGLLQISARIYRVGILMYGKRPTLPELLRWVKQT
jgi:ABC-2 type transport system permease protein